jgi:phenylalanyl-tRNA synthetase alpha chain
MSSIDALEMSAFQEVATAKTASDLRDLEIRYLGRNGEYTGLLRQIGKLPADEKPLFGKKLNEAKQRLQERIEARKSEISLSEPTAVDGLDITMPGRKFRKGLPHILSQTEARIKRALVGLGFEFVEGPELEEVKYNFSALNYPPEHPAMDDQDTFYVDDERVMRTQCTALQGRTFEKQQPPLRVFTIGRCFRNEAVDRTHGHTFMQVDAFMIDEGIGMHHLKGTLGSKDRSAKSDRDPRSGSLPSVRARNFERAASRANLGSHRAPTDCSWNEADQFDGRLDELRDARTWAAAARV